MTELILPESAVDRAAIERLQRAMAPLPQVECPTTHQFADGMYAREMSCIAGTLIVGKVHRREHFFILAAGVMQLTTDEGVRTVEAPAVLVGKPGTKRAGFALTDCVCINVHRTWSTDLDEIEAEMTETDSTSLYDSNNRLKVLP